MKTRIEELEQQIENLKKRLSGFNHNHVTRVIKPLGECWACDLLHYKQQLEAEKKKSADLLEALKFYAYEGYGFSCECFEEIGDGPMSGWVKCDSGDNAREAIKAYEGDNICK